MAAAVSVPSVAPLPGPPSIAAVSPRAAEALPEAPVEVVAAARPAVAAASNTIEPSRLSRDEDAVRETLQDYENAYTTLDVVAAVDVWPSVDRRALARAFGTLKSQGLEFENCDVRVIAESATVHCFGTIQYVRKVGNSTPQVGRQEWLFKMRKHGSEWKIDHVTATQVSVPNANSRRRES